MWIVKKIAVGVCLVGVACTAGAVNWAKVYEGDGLIVSVDPVSMTEDQAGHVLVWTFVDHTQKPITSGNVAVTTIIERYSIDCRLGRYLKLSAQMFDAQGNLLGSPDLTGKSYSDIPPGSPSSFVEAAACRSRK